MEEGDRVNAELQRAAATREMRQVGVPALAGPTTPAKGDRVNAELQRAAATSETRQVGVPASAGPTTPARGRPRERGTPTRSRSERNTSGWSSGVLEL